MFIALVLVLVLMCGETRNPEMITCMYYYDVPDSTFTLSLISSLPLSHHKLICVFFPFIVLYVYVTDDIISIQPNVQANLVQADIMFICVV